MKTFKHFFALTAVHDIAVSTIMILCVPSMSRMWVALKGGYTPAFYNFLQALQRAYHRGPYFIYVATGLIHQWPCGEVVLTLSCFLLISSLTILANSFVYRYIHVCRPELSYLYTSKRWISFVFVLNVLILSNFTFVGVWKSHPDDAFKAKIYGENPDIDGKAFIGVSLTHYNKMPVIVAAYHVAVTLLFFIVGTFCAIRIRSALTQAGISANVKRLQRQMFRVLLFQTSCPTVFLYIPSCVAQVIFIGRVDTNPMVCDCIGFLYSLYPLFNSLVTMFSITDYRKCLLSLVRRWKCTQALPAPPVPNRITIM